MRNKLSDAIKLANKSALMLGSVAAVAMMGFAVTANAQDAGAEPEEVLVTGIRAALEQGLDVKRNSTSIVDSINAEDVGKFPDKNVAESLQRIPGVTIQRQFGEGAAVSIRGAGQDLTLTTLNGQNVASTGWFVLEPARRSFNYELLPSELVGNLEVYKSSQADLAEGGVGGTVVVKTRKPLDMPSLSLYASAEAQYQSDSDSTDPQLSGMGSWKNDSETFGALVSLVAQKRQLQRQGNEAFWEWGAGPVAFEQERERSAVTATFQFRPTDSLDLVFNAMDMEMAADNTNYALWLTQGNTSWSGVNVPESDKINGTPARGPLNVAYYQARPREATMKSEVYDFKATYTGEGFEASVQLGDTSSSGGTDFEMVVDDGSGGTAIPGGKYDFMSGKQTWDLNGFSLENYNPGSLVMGTGSAFNRTPKTDGETYLQGDIEFEVDAGPLKHIKSGFKVSDHNTTSRRYEYIQKAGFNTSILTSEVFDGTMDAGAGSYVIPHADAGALKKWAKASIVGEKEDLGSYSEITEENSAIYVMGKFEADAVRGNLGLRYVTTDATSTYFVTGKKTESSGEYDEFLPSANVAFDLTDDVILRASAARVMARPQYPDMYVNPNVVGSNDDLPNNQFWIVGNVGLQPFVSNQFDIGVEYYFDEGSLLSGAVFTKDVKNFVNLTSYHADSVPFEGVLRPAEVTNGWTVQEKVNGKAATINGLELQYQQDFGNGFGTIVNWTYTDAIADEGTFADNNRVLTDSSKNSYNLTGYYENDLFQVRMSYNWRSQYMLRESGSYGNRLHDDYGTLDMSASYFVTDNITLKLDASNLLEESSKQFGHNKVLTTNSGFSDGFPLYEYELARRITLGASVKF